MKRKEEGENPLEVIECKNQERNLTNILQSSSKNKENSSKRKEWSYSLSCSANEDNLIGETSNYCEVGTSAVIRKNRKIG